MRTTTLSLCLLLVLLLSACSLPGSVDESAACLLGNWEMSNADLNQMLATLIPVAGMSIPVGTFNMTFNGNDFAYFSDGYSLRVEMPDGYMESDVSFETTGSYTAEDGVLTLADLVSTQDISTMRAVINGETVEVPGANSITIPAPGSGPFTCSDTTLTIPTTGGPSVTASMIFTRLP